MADRYTQEQLKFLEDGYREMSATGLALAFAKRFGRVSTPARIRSALENHGFKCGRTNRLMPLRICTDEQAQFIREMYKTLSLKELTAAFRERFGPILTEAQIKSFITNHDIRCGRTGCFEKGHVSWNKGTKGLTHRNKTTFKTGSVPPNRKELGAERYNSKYGIYIKVAERDPYTGFPTRYKLKHVVVWEKNFGPVPKGMVVAFRDSDNTNCAPENLMLLTRTELLRLNGAGYKNAPSEVKPSLVTLAKIEAKARIRTHPLKCGRKRKVA